MPCVVFGEALAGTPQFDVRVCAPEPGPLRTSAGLEVTVPHGLDVLTEADTVIVPSWRDPAERPLQAVFDGLAAAHARGARVVGLCLGAYLLAEAGLLDGLAAKAHMSRRTFTRHFRERIGATVGDWLLGERLTFAQRLLETTEHSVEVIAALAGFGSPVSLRHHFRRDLGVSPSAWRSTFQGNRRALSAGICRPGLKIVSGDVAA